jgi:hypothetical protein
MTRRAIILTSALTGLVLIGAGEVVNMYLVDSGSEAGTPIIVIGTALAVFALWASLMRRAL